ncbi:MAG: carboxypeptidase-like regulatory domain-containing protein [Saprospiraceae bacterium]|nr:carboxypeptidase-like regulatory domain-containing protein [Saprospiraceae bacterium]
MKIPALTILFSFCWTLSFSQALLKVEGMVVDQNGQALPGATVRVSPVLGTTTDENGFYRLNLSKEAFALTASFVGYTPQTRQFYQVDLQNLENNTLSIHFTLLEDVADLPTATVTGKRIEKIYQNNHQIIRDFELAGDYLLLLLQERGQSFLSLQTESGDQLDTLQLPFKSFTLHKGCTGAFHVAGNWEAMEISVENKQIFSLKTYPVENFEESILPCIASTPDFILYKNHLSKLNQTTYLAVDRYTGINTVLKSIADHEKTAASKTYLSEIISEYYLAVGQDRFYNIIEDARWTGDLFELAVTNDLMAKVSYYENIVTKAISTAAFQHEGNWVIFDHQNDSLFYFSPSLVELTTQSISYTREDGWKEVMYQDISTQRIYATFEKKDQLFFKEVIPSTGATGNTYSLANKYYFPKEIKIKNGAAYFIAQGASTSPYRQIYKQYLVLEDGEGVGRERVKP